MTVSVCVEYGESFVVAATSVEAFELWLLLCDLARPFVRVSVCVCVFNDACEGFPCPNDFCCINRPFSPHRCVAIRGNAATAAAASVVTTPNSFHGEFGRHPVIHTHTYPLTFWVCFVRIKAAAAVALLSASQRDLLQSFGGPSCVIKVETKWHPSVYVQNTLHSHFI